MGKPNKNNKMYTRQAALLSVLLCAYGLDLDEESTVEVDPLIPNMQPGLLPPYDAIWRGATIDRAAKWNDKSYLGTDPNEFEDYYGVPLQIYRTFKGPRTRPDIGQEE